MKLSNFRLINRVRHESGHIYYKALIDVETKGWFRSHHHKDVEIFNGFTGSYGDGWRFSRTGESLPYDEIKKALHVYSAKHEKPLDEIEIPPYIEVSEDCIYKPFGDVDHPSSGIKKPEPYQDDSSKLMLDYVSLEGDDNPYIFEIGLSDGTEMKCLFDRSAKEFLRIIREYSEVIDRKIK